MVACMTATEWLMGVDWRIGLVLFGLAGLWWALHEIDLIERADREERRRMLSDEVPRYPLLKETTKQFERRMREDTDE